jgi:hypothetical protein
LGYEPSTQVLGEEGNHIGDEGAAALAAMLPGNRALTALDLLRNGITNHGARAFREALADNRTLTTLILGKGIAQGLKRELRSLLSRNQEAASPGSSDPDVRAIQSVYRTA